MSKGTNSEKPWTEAFKDLPADQAAFAKSFASTFHETFLSSFREFMPSLMTDALRDLGYNEEIAGMVYLLTARTSDSKEEVLRKALTLYSLAIDARERGNRLSVLSQDDVIVQEISGFEPVDSDAQTVPG